MKKIAIGILFCLIYHTAFSQWNNLNTSIQGDLYAVHFENTSSGMVIGDAGIYRTTNGGTSWSCIHSDSGALLNGWSWNDNHDLELLD